MPSLDSFVESLIHEHDRLVQMGVLQTYKNQADPDLCRNATEYTNNHRNKDAVEITLHFINQRTETCLHIEWK